MDPHERAVDADRLGGLGQLDGLPMGFARRPGARPRRILPMAEGEKADSLHKVKYRRRPWKVGDGTRVSRSRMPAPVPSMTATVAAARVSRAGALLGTGGLAASGVVVWRLTETWSVTPAAASHRISVLGQRLTYPAANLGAVVVVGLALAGLAVIAIAAS